MGFLTLLLSLSTATAALVWDDCADPRFNECNVIRGTPQDDFIENTDADECVVVFAIEGDDIIKGSSLGDCISGGPGKDVIYGEDGDDYIMGGLEGDSLFGGAGNDVIWSKNNPFGTVDNMNGGPGNDVLIPGLGVNNMTGGRPGKCGKNESFIILLSLAYTLLLSGNNTFVWQYDCRHIIHDVPNIPDIITDYDPKNDNLDFSAIHFQVTLETYEYEKETILDLFPVESGTMIRVTYAGASSDFVLLEGYFGTLDDMAMVKHPAASDVFKPCLPGDEVCYEARCNVTRPTPVMVTPKNYDGCMQVNGDGEDEDDFILVTCDTTDLRQQFVLEGNLMKLALDPFKCAQAGRLNSEPSHGHFLRVFPCDATNVQQKFSWNDDAILLMEFEWLAVVFQGVKPDVNSDRIIVGDLRKPGILERKDWIIYK